MRINEIALVTEVTGTKIKAEVFSQKNSIYLVDNGELIKNVSVGNYVKIIKGFTKIVGVIEGESIKEDSSKAPYSEDGEEIKRYIIVQILGKLTDNEFIRGISEMPMIYNPVFILNNDEYSRIFYDKSNYSAEIGKLLSDETLGISINLNSIFNGHIGIFGNTGSGKSNTLAKIYFEFFRYANDFPNFKKKSQYVLFDFNGEYITRDFLKDNRRIINLNTKRKSSLSDDKIIIQEKTLINEEILSILFGATEKTQEPFINRVVRAYFYDNIEQILDKDNLIDELSKLIFENCEDIDYLQKYINDFLKILNQDETYIALNLRYNVKQKGLFYRTDYDIYLNSVSEVKNYILGKINLVDYNIFEISKLQKLKLVLNYKFVEELGKKYINKEHIAPLLKRAQTRIRKLEKIISIGADNRAIHENNLLIINLRYLDSELKKIIPLIVCKSSYDTHVEKVESQSTLNFIIDEAHNILSSQSERENSEIKDYRLEVFEEIIKEGRKFGVFFTVCSQRPSDISTTIISQINHYFIHRLMNSEDLRIINNTVSFLDKTSYEMISSLPSGACILTGISINFPMLIQVDLLHKTQRPNSENVDYLELWTSNKNW